MSRRPSSPRDRVKVATRRRWALLVLTALTLVLIPHPRAQADVFPVGTAPASATDAGDRSQVLRVITLRDYNTRVVVLGTALLGLAAGVVGTYMLLRRRALVGDALSHATLPGIAIAFLVMVALGGTGKFLPGLLLGAWASGLLGVGAILLIKGMTRIKEDAALGIVLSVTFGLGIALLGLIQKMPTGNQAGLESFIYGKAASMLQADAMLIGVTAVVVLLVCTILYKEFTLLSFDRGFADAQGWPTVRLDVTMMMLVTGVTVIGLQAVGLILVVAMLIIPAAAARFWTDHLRTMLVIAGAIGASCGLLGAGLSAMVPDLPAGAIIVVIAAAIFFISMLVGARRGLVVRVTQRIGLRRAVSRQHLLRAMYEWLETHDGLDDPLRTPMPHDTLLEVRSWSAASLGRALRRARRRGWVAPAGGGAFSLTERGRTEAARVATNHRLWEMYLITHADIAPSHVDRDADQIEHVLGPEMVCELRRLVAGAAAAAVPPSPHALPAGGGSGGDAR